jgi:lipopolysaccharide export system permease protein
MGIMFLFIFLEAGRRVGVGPEVLLSLVPTILPYGLKYALPVSLLLAVTFTFSRMASDNEIIALRASGSSLWPLAAPVLLAALLLSGILLCVTLLWLPQANVQRRAIYRRAALNVLENLPPGEHQFEFGRARLAYGNARGQVLEDIFLSVAREQGLHLKITAKEGRWNFDRRSQVFDLRLRHSQWTWFGEKKDEVQKVSPEEVPFRLDLEDLYPSRPKRAQGYTYTQMLGLFDAIRDFPPRLRRHWMFRWTPRELEYELHSRFAGALSPLIMALLGMPLGVLVRQRGKLTAFFAGFLPILAFYYPLTLVGEGFGTEGGLPPAAAAWGADVLVGLLGGVLTWRMIFR